MEYWAYQAATRPQKALTGRIFEHDGSTWTLVEDWAAQPDTIEAEGLIQTGDFIGPWILDDLREAILLLKQTATGTEFGSGTGSDGLSNWQALGSVYHVIAADGGGHTYGKAIVRHNLNPYLRTTVSGRNGVVVAGNWNGTPNGVGDCYLIGANVTTGGSAGGPPPHFESDYGHQAPDILTTLWGGIQHSTPWRRRSGSYNNSGGGTSSTLTFGTVTYNYTNTDYTPTPYAPSGVWGGNSMIVGFRGYSGGDVSYGS